MSGSSSSVSVPSSAVDFLARPRYTQATYAGRVQNFFSVIDPLTLLKSDDEVRGAVKTLQDYQKGVRTSGVTQETIWAAKKLKDSAVHPDTGDLVSRWVRFSAFVPVNVPLVVGMLSSSTPAGTIFWQWANQSYNVAVNYGNRNIGKDEMTQQDIAISYAAAVASSCSIALGLGKVVENLNKSPNPGLGIRVFRGAVPFFAVASAGVLNVALMRRGEMQNGVSVKDHEGVERGTSVTAGKKAIAEVAMTRVALPAPILLFPPLIMSIWDRLSFAQQRPKLRPIVQVPVITACLWLALPFAIGLFPQQSSIAADQLEPKFRDLKDSKGNKIDTFFFNKGL